MSEKRFEVINARWQGKGEAVAFEDTQTNQVYFAEKQEECERIVELLNKQDKEIQRLKNLEEQYFLYWKKLDEIMQEWRDCKNAKFK